MWLKSLSTGISDEIELATIDIDETTIILGTKATIALPYFRSCLTMLVMK